MSELYDKYFKNGDRYSGLASVLYDVRKQSISKSDLEKLADELVQKQIISETGEFQRVDKWKWNKKYCDYLMNGLGAGRVSKDYLSYYFDVCKYQKSFSIVSVISAFVVIVVCLLVFLSAFAK